ncbi:MAG: nucleotidyltransferase family protein [Negativicutes bacterium]
MKLDLVVLPNRDRILQTAARHGARSVRLFGSVARRQDDADSDIDFLVDMEPGRSLFDHGGLLVDFEKLLNKNVGVATELGLKDRIRDRVLNEAVPL